MHQKDKNQKRRSRQEGHQVIADRERQDKDHENEQVVVATAPQPLAPATGEPGEQRNREERNRIDLFIHIGLVPDREGGGADQGRCGGADLAEERALGEEAQNVVDDEEPEPVRECAHERRKEIDANRGREAEGFEEDLPGAGQQDKERISGRVGDSQDMRGGDVFAGIPEGSGAGQGGRIENPDCKRHGSGPDVGRPGGWRPLQGAGRGRAGATGSRARGWQISFRVHDSHEYILLIVRGYDRARAGRCTKRRVGRVVAWCGQGWREDRIAMPGMDAAPVRLSPDRSP